jgi:hypothetical protein
MCRYPCLSLTSKLFRGSQPHKHARRTTFSFLCKTNATRSVPKKALHANLTSNHSANHKLRPDIVSSCTATMSRDSMPRSRNSTQPFGNPNSSTTDGLIEIRAAQWARWSRRILHVYLHGIAASVSSRSNPVAQ